MLPLRVNWQALLRCPIEWNLNYSSHMMNWTATCSLPSPFAGTFVLFPFLLRKCLRHMRMPNIACSSDRKVGGISWLQTDSPSVKECIFPPCHASGLQTYHVLKIRSCYFQKIVKAFIFEKKINGSLWKHVDQSCKL